MDMAIWAVVGVLSMSAVYVMATESTSFKTVKVTGGKKSSSSTQTPPQPANTQTTTDSAPSILNSDESMHDGGTQADPPPKHTDDSPAPMDVDKAREHLPVVSKAEYDAAVTPAMKAKVQAKFEDVQATDDFYNRGEVPNSDSRDESRTEGGDNVSDFSSKPH